MSRTAFVLWWLLSVRVCDQYDVGFRHYSREYVIPPFGDYESSGLAADKYLCFMFGLCHITVGFSQSSKFKKIYEWNKLDFDYNSDAERQQDIASGDFHDGEIAPIDVDVFYGHEAKPTVFIATPRFQPGVPVTLGVIQGYTGNVPKIKPYPNWSFQRHSQLCSPDRVVSVFRVMVDAKCKKLWVLDTGKIMENQVCPPQVLAFDLSTNTVVHRFELDDSLYTSASIFVTPVVDVRESCNNPFVYLADCQAFTIIVHDVARNKAWKVGDKTMYPYPDQGTYTIQGDSFELMDGVLGMALEPYVPGRDRKLFYHAMSSVTENWVYTSKLRNESLFVHGSAVDPKIFHVYPGRRESQSAAEGIDRNGVAFFGQMTPTTINCWNTDEPYGGSRLQVVERNAKTLQFASGLKVVDNPRGHQELWVLTSRFQKAAVGALNPAEVNFRVMYATTDEAVRGTSCRRSGRHGGGDEGGSRYGGLSSGKRPSSDKIIFANN